MDYDAGDDAFPAMPAKRPGFLQSYHSSQPDIPELPVEHRNTRDHYWNYGWPMSMEDVRAFLQVHRPRVLDNDGPTYFLLAAIGSHAAHTSDWFAIRHVLVEPMDTVNGLSEILTPDGRPAVSFFMVVSTASEYYFQARPLKRHMAKLTELFGKEPIWMKDAVEKKLWHEFYNFQV
ncbi:hypothetical protein BD626DRAFT_507507 [Schizophyllum amplum]|uniref:Uncharacterized protein n=1 Tax=Schizophyllum amplum TaxID=97359 RepID=A0A550C446_9AGAR|nr:hypothetical protein BD626DRAFT_507507 [Auriculariopsis ampla]